MASIRWVRPGLHHVRPLAPPCCPEWTRGAPAPGSGPGSTAAVAARWIEDGNTSLEDCEAFTTSFGCTGRPEPPVGERGQHLVHVHVGRGARAGLEHVHRELGVVGTGDDLRGGRLDRLRHAPAAITPSAALACGGGRLDLCQRGDLRPFQRGYRRSGSSPRPAASAPATAHPPVPGPRPSCRARCGTRRPCHPSWSSRAATARGQSLWYCADSVLVRDGGLRPAPTAGGRPRARRRRAARC